MEVNHLSLFHLVRKPKTQTERTPLLIMLHGYGSNEADLFSFADELPEELLILSLRAPYALPPYGHAWYEINWDGSGKFSNDEQAVASREKIAAFIAEAVTAYPVDADNVTLVGFSQGCILALAVALSYPHLVRNVIGLSGYLNQNILKDGYEKGDFSRLAVYASHGISDPVIPVEWARKTKPILDALGIVNSYSEFPVGHGVSPQNLFELKNWLTQRL